MKICCSCKRELPATEFWKQSRRKDGLQTSCKVCMREKNKAWAKANRELARAHTKKWAERNREALCAKRRESYHADIASSRKAALSRYQRRKPKVAEYMRERRATSITVQLRTRISAQLRYCLGTGKGGQTAETMLGYKMAELRAHLEKQFLDGMGWHNMGEWHIDHIVPLASFTITGPDDPELRRAWALTNLRPLWAEDNIRKGAKVEVLL